MVSIKEVAQIAGVSIATVSRYINSPEQVKEHTRIKVKRAILSTGYAPNVLARNFRRGKTHQVVVVIPTIGAPFFEGVMRGIWNVANQNKYTIVVRETCHHTLEFDDFTRMVLTKQADGIILLASLSPFQAAEEEPRQGKQPPLVIGLENVTPELSRFPSVRIDNVAAVQEAMDHLFKLGHKDIAFFYGQPHADSTLTQHRVEGFRLAMKNAGLEVNEAWLRDGKMTVEGGRAAAREILSGTTLPTAIFCANDEMALGALYEVKKAGLKVPHDMSLIGFDNISYAEISDPPITTVAQPTEEIGERVMRRLCKAIDGEEIGCEAEVVEHRFIVRGSTAAAQR